ncbi:hypothetical protein LF95_05155 [Thalassospira sp. TSL5-1]|nr:hypothetical protein LF95_05155 [Thalassospira sp. TSL5-1]
MIKHHRITLRDFTPADGDGFVAYQMDARYRALYNQPDSPETRATSTALFQRFLGWQAETPRQNFQIGIFDAKTGDILGCIGLRQQDMPAHVAIMGLELAPTCWGRYRLALDAINLMLDYGFNQLGLTAITGSTGNGNRRITRLATWFGATLTQSRPGPDWMTQKGWHEVDWSLTREEWLAKKNAKQTGIKHRPGAS